MYTVTEIIEENTWDALPHTQWQHTWEFGVIQQNSHRSVLRLVIKNDEDIVGYIQAIAYDLYRDKTIVYCPYGPTWITEPNDEAWSTLKMALTQYAQQCNAIAVRIESDDSLSGFSPIPGYMYHASFHAPRGEMLLDISQSLDELSGQFHKKTSYNIRKAARNGLFSKMYSGVDMLNHVDLFIELNKQNMASHNTTTHADTYFKTLFETLSKNDDNFVIVTYSGLEEVQAINVFTVWRKGSNKQCHCPYGASTRAGKKSGAYYFIKLEAIKHLQTNGVQSFNWGGISVGLHDESLSGLNQFKQGFGGQPLTHLPLRDMITNKWWYFLYKTRAFVKQR